MDNVPRGQLSDCKNRQPSQYKTIEQIVKMGKANTKPVSVRLSVSTLEYFEENAKKFNSKTGTIISNVLDDYVGTLRSIEHRNQFEVEMSLMAIYRHLADKDPNVFFVRQLIEKTSSKNSGEATGDTETNIVRKDQTSCNGKTSSIFYSEDLSEYEKIAKDVVAQVTELSKYIPELVSTMNGDPEDEPAPLLATADNLFVNLSGTLLTPYNIDKMHYVETMYGNESIYVIPAKDWLLMSTLIIECATIKTKQLGRNMNIFRFVSAIEDLYNETESKIAASTSHLKKTKKDQDSAARIRMLHYRRLIHAMAAYEDLPSDYEPPTNLDEEGLKYGS